MEDALTNELDELRAENKILRDSLSEQRPGGPDDACGAQKTIKAMAGLCQKAAGQAKEALSPCAEKLTGTLKRQMADNPAPILLAAFGVGFLACRRLRRK